MAIKVGDTFYVQNMRRSTGTTGVVTKVGRKYFTVRVWSQEVSFHLANLKEHSSINREYYLYSNEEAYKAKIYHTKLSDEIYRYFSRRSQLLSIEKLEAIAKIVNLDISKGE